MRSALSFVLGLVIALFIVSSLPAAAQTSTPCPPATSAPTSSAPSSASTAVATLSADFGTHDNPVPLGVTARVPVDWFSDTYIFDIAITSASFGPDTVKKLAAVNSVWNTPPPSGMTYLLVYIQGKFISGPSGKAGKLGDFSMNAVSDGQFMDTTELIPPDPKLDFTGFAGAKVKGYLAFKINADDPAPLLAVGSNTILGTASAYFALTKP